MTILADKQIHELSTQPLSVLTQGDTSWLSHATREEVIEINKKYFGDNTGDNWLIQWREITDEDLEVWKPMIEPFVCGQVRTETVMEFEEVFGHPAIIEKPVEKKIISYGLSSYGYDVRLSKDFKIFTNLNSIVIDPLDFDDEACLKDHHGDYCIIPPNSYVLGNTIETFNMPNDVTAICVGKSTYARAGVGINVTPIEAGFQGTVVIEIANYTSLPVKVYAGMGIAQFLFFKGDVPCDISYASRNGKYMGQDSIVTPRV